ncbi:MAG: twin-arginine translocation signal domain-containing protein, partial [Variovorax sp.]
MNDFDRRRFLQGMGAIGASGALGTAAGPAFAAMAPEDKFDLLLRNADVLDPSQNLRGRRDIGIRFGKIEAVEASIAP